MNPLSTILGDIQLGHHFSPLVYRFSEELIYKYADAVDDFNLFHRDPVKASSGPFGGIIAPPALASLFVLKAYRTDWSPPEGGIQREQRFSFFAPIRPGDIITIRAEITQKVKKNENWVLTFTSHGKNQKEEIVVLSESTSVWGHRNKKVEKHQRSNTNHVKNRAAVIRDDPVSVIGRWDIGDSLPTLTKKIHRGKIDQYEEILGIGNPIHFDEEYAKKTPFKGVIAHGLMSVAYLSESMMKVFPWEWVHHGTMDIRFLHPLRPGDTVRTHGELERKESTGKGMSLVFDVGCKNQHGETVVRGTSTVVIDRNK